MSSPGLTCDSLDWVEVDVVDNRQLYESVSFPGLTCVSSYWVEVDVFDHRQLDERLSLSRLTCDSSDWVEVDVIDHSEHLGDVNSKHDTPPLLYLYAQRRVRVLVWFSDKDEREIDDINNLTRQSVQSSV